MAVCATSTKDSIEVQRRKRVRRIYFMKIRFEEGYVEGRRGFYKVDVIFIPEENMKWSFFSTAQ